MNSTCYLCQSSRYRDVFHEDGVPLRRCLNCRHVYSGWEQDNDYDGYWDKGVDKADIDFWDIAHRPVYKEFLRQFMGSDTGTIVDVGCGLGFFAATIRRDRPGWTIHGYELSEAAVAWAVQNNGLAGVVRQGAVEAQAIEPESVDIVTMWDVIEHIPRPQALLRHVAGLLKPNGVLFLQTPNWPFQYARARVIMAKDRVEVPGKMYLAAKDHVNQFSRQSLSRMALDTGFAPPTFSVLPPVMAFGGKPSPPGILAKKAIFQCGRLICKASAGHVILNPTLFAFLNKRQV